MSLRTTPYGTGLISHCSKGGFPSLPPFPRGVRGWRRVTTEIHTPVGLRLSAAQSIPLGGGLPWDIFPCSHNILTPPGSIQTPLSRVFTSGEGFPPSHLLSVPSWSPEPTCTTSPQESKSPTKQQQEKEAASRAGEEGKVVSKPGHIKRLFPWQPLVPTAAQACFNHLPINSAGVCTPFPEYLHWDGWGHLGEMMLIVCSMGLPELEPKCPGSSPVAGMGCQGCSRCAHLSNHPYFHFSS